MQITCHYIQDYAFKITISMNMKCELIRDESLVIHTTLYCMRIALMNLSMILYSPEQQKKALNESMLV